MKSEADTVTEGQAEVIVVLRREKQALLRQIHLMEQELAKLGGQGGEGGEDLDRPQSDRDLVGV